MTEEHFLTRQTEQQKQLFAAAQRCRARWNTAENLMLVGLAGTDEQRRRQQQAEGVYRSVENSLRFNQYRRAVWYLAAYEVLCRQIFSPEALQKAKERLEKWLEK